MNRSSSLFQEISENEIISILREHFQTEQLNEYKLLAGGMFNTTYQVTYGADQHNIILRLGPVNQHLLIEFEKHLMEAEGYVYDLCKEKDIPFPKVLVLDTSRRLFDRDYMITEFLDTVPMINAGVSDDVRTELYQKTGAYISRMHTVTSDTFGFVYDCMKQKSNSSWYSFLIDFVSDILEKSRKFNGFSEEEINAIMELYQNNKDLLEEIKTPCLLHCDLWDGNLLLKQEQDKFDLEAIIDGDRAVFGDPDFEFASGWIISKDFLSGYGMDIEDYNSEKREKRRAIYSIVYVLIDAYVNLAEYNQLEQYKRSHERIRMMLGLEQE